MSQTEVQQLQILNVSMMERWPATITTLMAGPRGPAEQRTT
jgi:hypothetical protein